MRLLTAVALLLTSCAHAANPNSTYTSSEAQVLPSDFNPPQTFKNLNILRNINLDKGYVRETINAIIENIDKQPQSKYYLPFSNALIDKVGGLEAWEKNAEDNGRFKVERTQLLSQSSDQYFVINLPKPLEPDSRLTLSISYYLLSALNPLPPAIEQDAKQYFAYTFSAYAPSAYVTYAQRTKVKFPTTDIPDYTTTSGMKVGSGSDPEKQGNTFTYGPYNTKDVTPGTIEPITVRYEFTRPIITATLLERDIEVSHWGGNLATEDRYWLQNNGAHLAKQFSRVAWSVKTLQNAPSVAISALRVTLKSGAVDPYFIDEIGNVSTSRFTRGQGARASVLDIRPRYPVFGGWKYSFRIGWNIDLSSFLRKATSGDTYILKVPFLDCPKMPEGLQYEKIDLRVILPEGARGVKYELVNGVGLPNNIQSETTLYKTYMDTVGRTVLKLSMTNVADEARDAQLIVTYDYPFLASFRKPMAVFVGMLSVFVAAWVIGNIDVSIKKSFMSLL
ncbi:oligosaccharyltransferase alpha subunit ostA [Coccidioides immitis RS]|uniref:Dolichyl-diphosphooligosaccharide--protein glycosyltransferase subunit 1 n=1 Tax=Coccidioides immitis (strain RS) TaxID=246410 RepID=J3KI89_COCIM|nr:oligosaccharyltransferase alpha subunit ostA [Coccidioides immitis RS]EAS35662.3 oligosaccharyltransferase alpha subunit ostA [Coccidioides immitis RS]